MMFINEVIATMTADQTLINALLVLGVVSFIEMQVCLQVKLVESQFEGLRV